MFQIDLSTIQSVSSWLWIGIGALSILFLRVFVLIRRFGNEEQGRKVDDERREREQNKLWDVLKSEQEDRRSYQRSVDQRMAKLQDQNFTQQQQLMTIQQELAACLARHTEKEDHRERQGLG